MNRTNVVFLKEQLCKAIEHAYDIDVKILSTNWLINSTFKVWFDDEEKQEPKTNFDEIMYHFALPKLLNKDLKLDDVCETLVTGRNEIPLWIKVNSNNNALSFNLTISKRFRKRKVIEEWHKSNKYCPVIIEGQTK